MKNKIVASEPEWKEGNVKNFFSKELLILGNGPLKLVKAASSALYPEHIHRDKTEFAYVMNCHPHFKIGADEFDPAPGEFYVFPSNVMQSIRNRIGGECVLLVGSIKNIPDHDSH